VRSISKKEKEEGITLGSGGGGRVSKGTDDLINK